MKKTLLIYVEYALVELVTSILWIVFFVLYLMNVMVRAIKQTGRFFSDNG